MGRVVFLVALSAAVAGAQEPAALQLSPLLQTAAKQTAAWQTLAKGLELKIARMLPCDPRARDAIEEVSRASQVRLAAQTQYLQALAASASRDSQAASAALNAEQAGARDVQVETAEAQQDRIAIEGQVADLAESVKSKPELEAARAKLASIAAMVRQRAADEPAQAARRTALIAALTNVAGPLQARQKAIDAEIAALAAETARWSDYYAARLARAQTECAITNPARKKR